MESKEFKRFRKRMNKTQSQMAQLLGVSVKAVHSYEQGWRNIPAHVERQMFFLISNMDYGNQAVVKCNSSQTPIVGLKAKSIAFDISLEE